MRIREELGRTVLEPDAVDHLAPEHQVLGVEAPDREPPAGELLRHLGEVEGRDTVTLVDEDRPGLPVRAVAGERVVREEQQPLARQGVR